MGKGSEELLREINIKSLLGEDRVSKRLATKILILSVAKSKDNFQVKDVKGSIVLKDKEKGRDSEEVSSLRSEVRNSWGVFSGRKIEDMIDEFRRKEILKRKDSDFRKHFLTSKGEHLWTIYQEILGLATLRDEINFLYSKKVSFSVNQIGQLSEVSENMSKDSIDRLLNDIRNKNVAPDNYLVDEALQERKELEIKLYKSIEEFESRLDSLMIRIVWLQNVETKQILENQINTFKALDILEADEEGEIDDELEEILQEYRRDMSEELSEIEDVVKLIWKDIRLPDYSPSLDKYDERKN